MIPRILSLTLFTFQFYFIYSLPHRCFFTWILWFKTCAKCDTFNLYYEVYNKKTSERFNLKEENKKTSNIKHFKVFAIKSNQKSKTFWLNLQITQWKYHVKKSVRGFIFLIYVYFNQYTYHCCTIVRTVYFHWKIFLRLKKQQQQSAAAIQTVYSIKFEKWILAR